MRAAGANPSSDPDVQGVFDCIWPVCLLYITSEWADIVPVFLGHLMSAIHALPPSRSLTKAYNAQPVRPPAVRIVCPLPAVAPASSSLTPVAAATSAPLSSAPSPITCSGSSGSGLSQLAPPSSHVPSLGPGPSPLTVIGPEFFLASTSLPSRHIMVRPTEPRPAIILPGDDSSDSAPARPAKHVKSTSHDAACPAGLNEAKLIPKADLPATYTSCSHCWDMKKRCMPLCTAKLPFGDCGRCVRARKSCVRLVKAKGKSKEEPKEPAKELARPAPRVAGMSFFLASPCPVF